MTQRQAVAKKKALAYQSADRTGKGLIPISPSATKSLAASVASGLSRTPHPTLTGRASEPCCSAPHEFVCAHSVAELLLLRQQQRDPSPKLRAPRCVSAT